MKEWRMCKFSNGKFGVRYQAHPALGFPPIWVYGSPAGSEFAESDHHDIICFCQLSTEDEAKKLLDTFMGIQSANNGAVDM